MKVHAMEHEGRKFEMWYDPHCRCWFSQQVDDEGYQTSSSFDAYTRGEIEDMIRRGIVPTPYEED